MRSPIIRITLLVTALAVAACGDDESSAGQADATPSVDAPPAALSWTNFASQFFQTYCQACHGPGDASRDYSLLADVRAELEDIKCGVSPTMLPNCVVPAGQFPVGTGPKPSEQERNQLVQWIDEGAIE